MILPSLEHMSVIQRPRGVDHRVVGRHFGDMNMGVVDAQVLWRYTYTVPK